MESDRGFVEYVQRAHKRASERGGEIYSLALAAGKSVGEPVEGQVAEAYVGEKSQSVGDFHKQTRGYLAFGLVESEFVKPFQKFRHGHTHKLCYRLASHLHVGSFATQTCAVTFGADGLAAIACEHNSVLYLVLLCAHPVEKTVNAGESVNTVPQHVFFGIGEFGIGAVQRKNSGRGMDEFFFPLLHLLATPAHHAVFEYRQRRVGNHKFFVYAYRASEAFAARTCAIGIVEVEHRVRWL